MNKERVAILSTLCIAIVIVTLSFTYAYFTASVRGSGNTTNNTSSATAISLGEIYYDGETTFTGTDLYPGYKNFQTFTIGPDAKVGTGIYEISLEAIVPDEFGSDIEITLYKTTDPASNYVERTEGTLTQGSYNGETTYYKEDTISIIGTLEEVYFSTLVNLNQIVLEQEKFENPGLDDTTYYLVYNYINHEYSEQSDQEGLSFSGKVTVKYSLADFSSSLINNCDSSAASCLLNASTSAEYVDIAYDETVDNNLRFIGKNPNNYVDIGNTYGSDIYYGYYRYSNQVLSSVGYMVYTSLEDCQNAPNYHYDCEKVHSAGDPILWRIVGVMNNIEGEDGTKASRLKIIRDESIGVYSWDSSPSTVNGGDGVNEWSQADVMTLLNETYYNATSSETCYTDRNNIYTPCDFSDVGLNEDLPRSLLDTVVWNTGTNGENDITIETDGLVHHFYEYERSSNTGKICDNEYGCNDIAGRTIAWTGKIGLIYPSDYGYATAGNSLSNREACLSFTLYYWHTNNYSYRYENCITNDWLRYNWWQWAMMPFASIGSASRSFAIASRSGIATNYTFSDSSLRPTIYLKSQVKIMSGSGTKENPYVLSL